MPVSDETHGHRPPAITLAMIARDAASDVVASLASARDAVDEIIVLDTGSRDDTFRKAAAAGARVFPFAWGDDFSAARNEALAHAAGDWVLWLDAGEVLEPTAASGLREFVCARANSRCAYLMYVTVPPVEGGASEERVARVRLVPNHPTLRYVGRVAETLDPALQAAGISKQLTDWEVRKPARSQWPRTRRQRAERNLRLAELELMESPRSPRALLVRGESLAELGRNAEAKHTFRDVLQQVSRGSPQALEAYYGLISLGAGESSAGDGDRFQACLEALEDFPLDVQLLCAMGSMLRERGRQDLAIRSFRAAYHYGQIYPEAWHLKGAGELAALCLATCQQADGQLDEARESLRDALTRYPHADRLRMRLVEMLVDQGALVEAQTHVSQLHSAHPGRNSLPIVLEGACVAARGRWDLALPRLEEAYRAGNRDPLCLRWLTRSLVALGNLEQAERVLEAWEAMDATGWEPRRARANLRAMLGKPQSPSISPPGEGGLRFVRRTRTDAPEGANESPSPQGPTRPRRAARRDRENRRG